MADMAPSKTQRWLDLLALLVGRRVPLSIDEIMEQVPAYRDRWAKGDPTSRASVRRMFERDKDELRKMGIPIETRSYRDEGLAEAEGYLIASGDFYLPYLDLISSEAGAGAREAGAGAREPGAGERRVGAGERGGGTFSRHSVGRVTLEEEDARTAVLALREVLSFPSFPFQREARSALRKLTFDLDPALAEAPAGEDEFRPAIRILDRPGGADPQRALRVLLDALYDRRRVRFRYHSIGRDVVEAREVEPWGLLYQWGSWYLAARDPAKAGEGPEVRLFRADRMEEARASGSAAAGPDFEVPADFDLDAYAGRKAWELAPEEEPELEVVVRFAPPASLLAERNAWGELVEEEAEDAALRSFRVRRLDPFLRWVLSLAGEAEVVSPPEAVRDFRRMAKGILELYREEAP